MFRDFIWTGCHKLVSSFLITFRNNLVEVYQSLSKVPATQISRFIRYSPLLSGLPSLLRQSLLLNLRESMKSGSLIQVKKQRVPSIVISISEFGRFRQKILNNIRGIEISFQIAKEDCIQHSRHKHLFEDQKLDVKTKL